MKAEFADLLIEAADNIGEQLEQRDEYSGRGMYGAQTTAVVFEDLSSFFKVLLEAGRLIEENSRDGDGSRDQAYPNLRMDGMGIGMVVY